MRLPTNYKLHSVVLLASLPGLCGCVSNRVYRPHDSVVLVSSRPALPSSVPGSKPAKVPSDLPSGGPCDELKRAPEGNPNDSVKPTLNPCLAFLEFDDLGRPWMVGDAGQMTQLDRALNMIKAAKRADPNHQPVVLVFFHGWQHNAHESPHDDDNIQGFENTLDWLSKSYYQPKPNDPGRIVVGIYVAWRGALASQYWPAAQVLSYFNREDAAKRVGGADLTTAIRAISTAAHTPYPDTTGLSTLLLVGHSFGAQVLEKAISPAFMQNIDEQRARGPASQITPLADLIIFINPADSATESKPLLDYVAREQVVYHPFGFGAHKPDWPLIVSVTTSADAATGVALPIGHFISGVQYELKGSFRAPDPLTCYHTTGDTPDADGTLPGTTWVTDKYSQWHFWTTSAPHDKALQSHADSVLNPSDPRNKPGYDPVSQEESCLFNDKGEPNHLYDDVQFPPRAVGGQCIQTHRVENACTGAAYWVMATDKSVLPSHSTIFTDRMIRLLAQFIPKPPAGYVAPGTTPPPPTGSNKMTETPKAAPVPSYPVIPRLKGSISIRSLDQ